MKPPTILPFGGLQAPFPLLECRALVSPPSEPWQTVLWAPGPPSWGKVTVMKDGSPEMQKARYSWREREALAEHTALEMKP